MTRPFILNEWLPCASNSLILLVLVLIIEFPLVLRLEEKKWRIRFSVPLWVDKLNKPSITAHVHQFLSALLSVENFIHELARCYCTGDSQNKTKLFMYVPVFVCVFCSQTCGPKTLATCRAIYSKNTHSLSIVICMTHHWDICIFFGRRVTFSHNNMLVNKRGDILTSALTSMLEIAMKLN